MDPARASASRPTGGLPRTRGDGPRLPFEAPVVPGASPHTRGWTRYISDGWWSSHGFPAHAGMDRAPAEVAGAFVRLPRTRGDGPEAVVRMAGWLSASPHTRGWTPAFAALHQGDEGFPAHAGMDPC